MIASQGHDGGHGREIARGLAASVQGAIDSVGIPEETARALAWDAAASVAELLELQGLAALLAACRAHAAAPPTEVVNALDRLARLAEATHRAGTLDAFTAADRELAALAGTLGAQAWSATSAHEPTPRSLQSLAELLSDFELDDAAAIARAQVTLPVAAGLRAALDWLGADLGGPLRVSVHDAALTLAARVTHEPGLAPAGAVLALTGGALLPEPDGRWSLRVPLLSERPAFLLARQGVLSLALPWHAVARLRIADENARAAMTEPSLTPWSPLERAHGERPAALVALGLARAWLHLDHIVWRVFAHPEPAEPADRVPGGRAVVRTEEGGEYRVVDVSEALAGVPPLHTPPVRPRPRLAVEPPAPEPGASPADEASSAETSREMEFAEEDLVVIEIVPDRDPPERPEAALQPELPEPPPAPAEPEPPAAPPALRVLGPEHVRPLTRPRAAEPQTRVEPWVDPAEADWEMSVPDPSAEPESVTLVPDEPAAAAIQAGAAGAESPAGAPSEAEAGPRPRRALVVDDSLVAQMSLARVLEREGYRVETADTADEMWGALQQGEWSLVLVDVFLPDASGRAHLRSLVAQQLAASVRFELVALTRDPGEEKLVGEVGITRTLRKPFRPGVIEQLVRDLPGPPGRA